VPEVKLSFDYDTERNKGTQTEVQNTYTKVEHNYPHPDTHILIDIYSHSF